MGLAAATTILMAATLISRLLGIIRERAVADIFGRGAATDAYTAAFGIPDLMYQLLVGGALSAAFIPVFTEYLAREKEQEAWEIATTFINVVVLLLTVFTLLGIIFTPILAPLVAYEFQGEELSLLISLMRLTFPAVFFTALAGVQMGLLNSYRDFLSTAIGPILYNLGIILGTYLLGPRLGVVGMAYGAVIGAVGNFLVQLPATLRHNHGYRLRIDLHHPALRRMLYLMVPAAVGLSIGQFNVILTQNLASGLASGSMTALRLANRVMQFPLGVIAMGFSQAIFPTLSRQVALQQMEALKKTIVQGLRFVFFLTIPSAFGLAVLGQPIIRFIFQTGQFTAYDTIITARTLLFYALGLLGLSGVQVLSRVFYSLKDTRTPVKVAVVNLLVNLGLGVLFLHLTRWNERGLALSFALAALLSLSTYLLTLRRRIGPIGGRSLASLIILASLASLPMSAAAWGAAELSARWFGLATLHSRALQVLLGVSVGAVVYGVSAWLLRIEEVHMLVDLLRRMGRVRRQPAREGGTA